MGVVYKHPSHPPPFSQERGLFPQDSNSKQHAPEQTNEYSHRPIQVRLTTRSSTPTQPLNKQRISIRINIRVWQTNQRDLGCRTMYWDCRKGFTLPCQGKDRKRTQSFSHTCTIIDSSMQVFTPIEYTATEQSPDY